MSYTVNLQKRIQQLKKIAADELPDILYETAKQAAMAAVEAAAAATPPKEGTGRGSGYSGTNTLTGELKAHWAADSVTEPQVSGGKYTAFLANSLEYASYVNDGHRMDRHFVPGLYVNPYSKLLEYDPSAETGLVVGTKTLYVPGEFMTDKGREAYEKTVLHELDRRITEVLR